MNYLITLATLLAFFCVVIYYLKKQQSPFAKLEEQPLLNNVKENEVNVNYLDTRYEYPHTPPVNPNVYKSLLVSSLPVSNNLYSNQENIDGYILDQNQENENTNQLNYSGGSTQLIKIPLQMNEPYNEQLRTQEVLITPYNRVKYNISDNC